MYKEEIAQMKESFEEKQKTEAARFKSMEESLKKRQV